jgi:hypothetical protein
MKFALLLTCMFGGILMVGCVHHHHKAPVSAAPSPAPAIVTTGDLLAGKVVACNTPGRFVVLTFPTAQMPAVDNTMFLYRAGMKVAEIRITGPQSDDNTVADIVTGEAQVGDEVRDK